MNIVEYPYAGLILPDSSQLDPGPYLDSAAAVLDRLDHIPGAVPHRPAHGSKVFGRRFGIIAIPEEDSDYGPRMLLEIVNTDGSIPTDERVATILSDVVLACLDHSDADILEWYAPDVLLDREDFVRLRSYVSPRRMPDLDPAIEDQLFENDALTASLAETLYPDVEEPAAPVEEDRPKVTDRLAKYRITYEPEAPEKRRMSIAGHLLTGVIGILYLPLAIALYILTLGRGMDFRLVSQALVVTALFTVLYNADRLNGVMLSMTH
ncbi:hypothetical protein [Sagittula sp. SSi028]|uniref:hypothetical protein n=1 Tax=Sagittula sp. SSi028 TaxID=3400636 RepID=UPI003AF8ADFA